MSIYMSLLICILLGILISILFQIADLRKNQDKIMKHLGIEDAEKELEEKSIESEK